MKAIAIIKTFWKEIAVFLVLVFIFAAIGINSCSEQIVELRAEKANISILRAFLIDSTRTSTFKAEIAKLDSVKAAEAYKTKQATANANYWQQVANKRGKAADKYQHKADSLSQYAGEDCKPFLDAYREANDSLQSENVALDSVNTAVRIESDGYRRQLYVCENQSSKKDSVVANHEQYINSLETNVGNLQCYREWGIGHPFLKWLFGWKCRK